MQSLANEERGVELTDMDYKFFFFPWFLQKEYALEANFPILQDTYDYFATIQQDSYFIRNYKGYEFTE